MHRKNIKFVLEVLMKICTCLCKQACKFSLLVFKPCNFLYLFLSLSSDYDVAVSSFLRVIRLACKLCVRPRLLSDSRSRLYTSGASMYTRADGTSSRIRAAFGNRLSSITSSSSDDHESPEANLKVFAPLEKVWEALEEWFLLLLSEMEDIESESGTGDCVLSESGPGNVPTVFHHFLDNLSLNYIT